MPNWCMNSLTISGDKSEIAKFREWLGNEPFTLQKIKPMPSELNDTTSPAPAPEYTVTAAVIELSKVEVSVFSEEWLAKYKAIENTLAEAKKQREYLNGLIAKYGADNWYDWHLNNWSTKWDVDAEFDDASSTDDCLIYNFDSAWSPPTNAIIELSNLFPNLNITLRYREDGMLFAGNLTAGNGEHDDIYVDGSQDKEKYRAFCIDEFGDDPFEWEEEQESEEVAVEDNSSNAVLAAPPVETPKKTKAKKKPAKKVKKAKVKKKKK